jgi:hypothetical protein
MDFYTAFQRFTAHTPAWVLILGLVMLCILACIFFSMMSASKPEPKPKYAPDAFQLAYQWNSNNIFYRRKQNDTWEPWNEKCYRPGCTGKMINQASRSENHKAYDIYVCNICGSAKGVEVNNMGGR